MTTSVVLVAYHGDAWLPRAVETLRLASEDRLHLVLVDNSGNTVIPGLDKAAFHTEIIRTPHPMGFAEANNFALVEAENLEPFVLFLNQDTQSPPGWIDACLHLFEDDTIGAVSPAIRTYDDDGWDPSFLACLSDEQKNLLDGPPAEAGIIDSRNAPAPALLVRTEVLRTTGPFDPIFGSYYEDYDLCRRIRDEGYRVVFNLNARIRHFSGSTTTTREKELRRMRQIIRNRMVLAMREAPSRTRTLARFVTADLPRRIARGMLKTPSSQPPGVVLRAYLDFLRLVPRLIFSERDREQWEEYLSQIGWGKTFESRRVPESMDSSARS